VAKNISQSLIDRVQGHSPCASGSGVQITAGEHSNPSLYKQLESQYNSQGPIANSPIQPTIIWIPKTEIHKTGQ
jgi:hypothetical protein